MRKKRIGIVGYGNIGRGVEKAVNAAPDMELVAVFTRRNPDDFQIATKTALVLPMEEAISRKGEIDVMILCGGSSSDLPEQGPFFAKHFNTVDSFDTHAKIPEYMEKLDNAAKATTAVLSAGWDPGLFSIMRSLMGSVLPDGSSYTFWGRGVSQGHSFAIRHIEGVLDAVQYTVPIDKAVNAARSGNRPELSTREKHLRECYVVEKEGADKERIEREIKSIPNYFADNDTTVTFISMDELKKNHSTMPHGGLVLRSGNTGNNHHVMEFSLNLESNPEFTASVLVAYARAAARLSDEKIFGAKTALDIPLTYLSPESRNDLIKNLL